MQGHLDTLRWGPGLGKVAPPLSWAALRSGRACPAAPPSAFCLVFCLIAQQLSSAVLEPSFLPQDVCFVLFFFFDVNYF